MSAIQPDLVILDAKVFTVNPAQRWAEAFAVTDGRVSAVGSTAEIAALAGPTTVIENLNRAFVMPGLNDVHVHLGLGGTMITWELGLSPADSVDEIYAKVRQYAQHLAPSEWVVGGVVGSTVLDETAFDAKALEALDQASEGHPVLLRDETMHNRWVNTAALSAMGVGEDTPDPDGSRYVRDSQGRLTGWLFEMEASSHAEAVFLASINDPGSRNLTSIRNAIAALNSVGVTSVQDAGSMEYLFRALQDLDEAGELTMRVVTSTPVAPFVEPGATGGELAELAQGYRSEHVRPDFVKFFLDGVPTTRTTALLEPYICHDHSEDPEYRGEPYWTLADLERELRRFAERGLGAKLHASGDGSVRRALDAIQRVRGEVGEEINFQLAHASLISDEDLPRFAGLNAVADSSPHMWFPNEILDAVRNQIPAHNLKNIFPHKTLLQAGAVVAAGSDWPVGAPSPSPWLGLQTIITRRSPDPAVSGAVVEEEALTLEEAIEVFTANPATAMGLGRVTGRLQEGLSADFIVLDRNLFQTPVDDISKTAVISTWFEGKTVYRR